MSWLSKLFKGGEPGTASPARPTGPDKTVAAAERSADEIVVFLRRHVVALAAEEQRPLAAEDVDPDADLYESGYIDSLSVSKFLLRAEETYGVKLPDYIIGGTANSLTKLAAFISEQLSSTKHDP